MQVPKSRSGVTASLHELAPLSPDIARFYISYLSTEQLVVWF